MTVTRDDSQGPPNVDSELELEASFPLVRVPARASRARTGRLARTSTNATMTPGNKGRVPGHVPSDSDETLGDVPAEHIRVQARTSLLRPSQRCLPAATAAPQRLPVPLAKSSGLVGQMLQ
jgi:hypothetical protein